MKLTDKYGRVHNYLRLSVTDRCNLNCSYCNPSAEKKRLSTYANILSFEEISRICKIFIEYLEFKKIRLTGGEPFARKDVSILIEELAELKKKTNFELSATSNAVLLKGKIERLHQTAIDRFNFSLDSLQKNKYLQICGSDSYSEAMDSIMEAIMIMPGKVKINTVVMRGVNDDELLDFADFAIKYNVPVRFIEYMPFSDNSYDRSRFVSYKEMIAIISEKYNLMPLERKNDSVSRDYIVEDNGGRISFISSMSEHFCSDCNRLRLTSDGKLKLCLFSNKASDLDIKLLLRTGESDLEISEEIINFISGKKEMHDKLEDLIIQKNSSMISVGG